MRETAFKTPAEKYYHDTISELRLELAHVLLKLHSAQKENDTLREMIIKRKLKTAANTNPVASSPSS